jgi:predicted PurR-regulated permease PerM
MNGLPDPGGELDERDGGATRGDQGSTYRSRMWTAASRRGVPLATIIATVVVAVAVVDIDALVILLLWVLRTIILYCLIAGFVALLRSPVVRLVERVGVTHGGAVAIVFVVAVLAFVGVVVEFTVPLVHAVLGFAKDVPNLVDQAEKGRGRIGELLKRLHLQNWVKKNAPKVAGDIERSLKPAQAISVGTAAFSTVVGLATIAVLSLFFLLESRGIRAGLLGMFAPERARRIARVYTEASRSVTGYMLGDALTSVVAGVVVFITLVIVGVPYPLLLGLWVALVDLLPLVGGLLAGLPVAVIALFHSLPACVVVVIVFLAYQQIENHVLNPLVMSRTVRMNPLWVLLAVLVGATLGDRVGSGLGAFAGALIGIPFGGALQVVVRELRPGRIGAEDASPGAAGGDGAAVP